MSITARFQVVGFGARVGCNRSVLSIRDETYCNYKPTSRLIIRYQRPNMIGGFTERFAANMANRPLTLLRNRVDLKLTREEFRYACIGFGQFSEDLAILDGLTNGTMTLGAIIHRVLAILFMVRSSYAATRSTN
jgi:hypothetical protein